MHTIWKGSISFGLVNIPVKLHAATDDKGVKFRTLHEKCHSPIRYEKVCPVCEEEVKQDEMVKAYEYTKGKFIIVDDKELEELKNQAEERAVEIVQFVKIEEIDPIYFDKSYYLSPNEGGTKAYSLLREALAESGKVGIAKMVFRSKEQLAVLRVYEDTIVMETIHYPDEVRNAKDVPNVPEKSELSKKELDTAILLIDQLTAEFNPEEFHDEYREAVLQFIEGKRTGEQVVTPKEKDKPTNVTDLMAALQASIDKTKPKTKVKPAAKKKAGTTKAKAKKNA
ncbi:Ku protein [Bacillus oleivorans]|uniref:Non-homologous end joining protein Ku n=1 Tax=Bacillus oleivorans TaxID=1448271 RepID=A0A285CLH4_9BACI|nr:Ku protein [Bacillus oleivorans]SNX68399.1 Ku protein [Bacillus oleivorans]